MRLAPSPPRHWGRRLRRTVLVVLLAALGATSWLAIDAHRDRTGDVLRRVGRVVRVEREPVAAPDGVVGEAITLESSSGLVVNLRLLRRATTQSDRLHPAAVILGGHNTGRNAVELVGDPGNVVVVALDYPIDGDEHIKGLVKVLEAVPRIRRALLDTPAAAALALAWLAEEPGVDPNRIELLGVSLGAVFAPIAAGIEPLASRLWLVHGGADPDRWLEHALTDKVAQPQARHAVATLAYYLARGPFFELDPWLARLAPRELVVIAAREDSKLPHQLVEDLLSRTPGIVRFGWTEGGHVDPDEPEIVRALISTVLGGIEGNPPPLWQRER